MENQYKDMAKVVSTIDDYRFVINHGSKNGVEVGANYLIFQIGDNIIDPDTGEDLGPLEIVRGRARVTHVQERLATLESSETVVIPGRKRIIKRRAASGIAAALLNMPSVEEIEEGSEIHMSEISASIGDIARPI